MEQIHSEEGIESRVSFPQALQLFLQWLHMVVQQRICKHTLAVGLAVVKEKVVDHRRPHAFSTMP